MNLIELQNAFQTYLLDDQAPSESAAPFLAAMIDDEKVGIQKRLNIYHHAYRARIIEAIATAYPNVKQCLGCERFGEVVQGYIAQNPSTFRNMRWVGDDLASYLQTLYPKQPFIADLATFEWALSLAFDAQDLPTLTIEDLSAIPPEEWSGLHFSWHPSVKCLQAQTQVIAAWQALEAGEPPNDALEKTTYLVWRHEMMSYFKTLGTREAQAIELMMSGKTFGDLCTLLAQSEDEAQAMTIAAGYLVEWLNNDMLLREPANH